MVSIVITNFNYGRFLQDCLLSCLAQTYPNIEIVVVDDNSSDDSRDILQTFSSKFSSILTIFLQSNMGYAHARNVGILASKGEFVAFLDSDDMLTPKSVYYRVREFERNSKFGLVHGYCLKCHNSETYRWCVENAGGLERHKSFLHAQGIMVRREVFDRYGLFFEGLRSKADKEMWYRLGVHPDSPLPRLIKSRHLDKPMAFYRRHPDAMHKMRVNNKEYNDTIERIFSERISALESEGITKINTRFP